MQSERGVITAVQEGRFRLLTDDGRVLLLVLSRKASLEPQDLPELQAAAFRLRVHCTASEHLIAAIAHQIEIED
jgi:hypothetical protein